MDFVHKDNKLTGFIFRETSHFQKFCVIYPQEHHMNVKTCIHAYGHLPSIMDDRQMAGNN